MVLDKYCVSDLDMRNEVCDLLTPDISHIGIPDNHKLYFINTYGFDSYEKIITGSIDKKIRIKCLCDDVETEIHFTKIFD